jgi:ARG and Rhodanese-Phosphatase-superfamily-associated Protein domain
VRQSAEPGLGGEQIHRAETRPLGAKLDEAGGLEVAVEGERTLDPQRPHEREARGVDKRVLAFVVPPEPAQRLGLQLQSGALLALGDRLCLDYVSRPEAFARLYPKLLEGYLLDALEVVDGRQSRDLDAFLAPIAEGALARRTSAGLGEDVRLRGDGVVASGLELDGELVQLCAFLTENGRVQTPIMRPSRRR